MRITGTGNLIPSHVARAYGLPQSRPIARPASTQPIAACAPAQGASATPSSAIGGSRAAESLIAGRAPGPITFDGVSIPRTNPGVLQLYTRAADKIEAATAVQIGRTLDITG
jgi:hypothetical protein